MHEITQPQNDQDKFWMEQAIEQAEYARDQGEVPIGAVLVANQTQTSGAQKIASGYNQPISSNDPTAHAEIIVLRKAGKILNNYRLINTTMYVTLEPCVMCIGAMIHARIKRLVFGAFDPKTGAITSVFDLLSNNRFNHKIEYQGGILASECGMMLSNFFHSKRYTQYG